MSHNQGHKHRHKHKRKPESDSTYLNRFEARVLRQQIVWDWFLIHPCVDCGESNPLLLENDHVHGQKSASISALVRNKAQLDAIVEELKKTESRCANCHRLKTASHGEHYKFVVKEGVDPGWKEGTLFDESLSFDEKGLRSSARREQIKRGERKHGSKKHHHQ